jgi:membrane protease YdiL (CAAX protease family)
MSERQHTFKGFFAADSLWIKGIMLLFAFIVFSVTFALLGKVVIHVFGITGEISRLQWMQLITSIGTFIVSSFFLGFLFSDDIRRFLSLHKVRIVSLVLVLFSMLVVIPLMNYLDELNGQISLPEAMRGIEDLLKSKEAELTELSRKVLTSDTMAGLFFNLFVMAVIPAIGEEFFFRGVIQKTLQQHLKNIHVAVWITAFIFSATHFQFYGFIPRFLFGAYFGYLLVWSRSIWLPVMAHFVNNATIVIYYFIIQKRNIGFDLETIGTNGELLWVGVSIVVFSFLVLTIWHTMKK